MTHQNISTLRALFDPLSKVLIAKKRKEENANFENRSDLLQG